MYYFHFEALFILNCILVSYYFDMAFWVPRFNEAFYASDKNIGTHDRSAIMVAFCNISRRDYEKSVHN